MMTVYKIKGLYLNGGNPTFYGTLKEAIKYVNSRGYMFIHRGEDVVICEGETPRAIQKWVKKVDEMGEYYEPQKWEVL